MASNLIAMNEHGRYLRDVAGQEERRPPTGGREEAQSEAVQGSYWRSGDIHNLKRLAVAVLRVA